MYGCEWQYIKISSACNAFKIPNYGIDQVFVQIKISTMQLILGVVYLPPKSNIIDHINHTWTVEDIRESHLDHEILVVYDDYNLPNVKWVPSENLHPDQLIKDNTDVSLNTVDPA